MEYYVTFGGFSWRGTPAPGGAGSSRGPFNLAEALTHACELLRAEYDDVTIKSTNGDAISGLELTACCRGKTALSPDLQAASNRPKPN
jgi:hypothetical protein